MNDITFYHNRLKKLQDLASVSVGLHREAMQLVIAEIPFVIIRKTDSLDKIANNRGILSRNLSPEQIRFCEVNQISYYCPQVGLKIFKDNYSVFFEIQKKLIQPKKKAVSVASQEIRSSMLISPNAFKIMDVLFRLPEKSLIDYRSGLALAKQFSLNQPRISEMMRAFNVRSTLDLKLAISKVPNNWWRMALSDKGSSKRLSRFFEIEKPHYSLIKNGHENLSEELERLRKSKMVAALGPLELPKQFGYLRDSDMSVWGSPEAIRYIKAKFKLIPGIEKEQPIWHLATPRHSFEDESILSNDALDEGNENRWPRENMFRSIWDLGFGTERLREVQINLLEKIFNGI